MIALLFSVLQQLQTHNPTTFVLFLIPITNLLLLIPITNLLLILQLTRNPAILTYSLIPCKNLALPLLFLEMSFLETTVEDHSVFIFSPPTTPDWYRSNVSPSLSVENLPPSSPTAPNPTTDMKPSNSNHRRVLRKLRKHWKTLLFLRN